MRPPWCDEWHPVMWTPAVTHHMTRVRGSSSVSSCCSSSVLRPGLLMANCDPSPALTSPLYQAATFDLCRCGDEMTAREHYLGWPHLTVTSEQTRELPPQQWSHWSHWILSLTCSRNLILSRKKSCIPWSPLSFHSCGKIILQQIWFGKSALVRLYWIKSALAPDQYTLSLNLTFFPIGGQSSTFFKVAISWETFWTVSDLFPDQPNSILSNNCWCREAFNKKTIFLLTFVNKGGGSGASFVNKKNHS